MQPHIEIDENLGLRLGSEIQALSVEDLERRAPMGINPFWEDNNEWMALAHDVKELFAKFDHVILRGLPVIDNGVMLLAAMSILTPRFMTYGDAGKVIKVIRVDPWSLDLARTAAEGYFHSDLNASVQPPALTGWQCAEPDPGAPSYGINRIARAVDIVAALRRRGDDEVLHFLCEEQVAMANDRSPGIFIGQIFDGSQIRFHAETIRAASLRQGKSAPEDFLEKIQQIAFEVSVPIVLGKGDMLILSNHRTLHYRGECSVVFRNYPRDFVSRKIYLAHGLHA